MKYIITKTTKGEYADAAGNRYGISEVKPGTVALGPGVQESDSINTAIAARGLVKYTDKPKAPTVSKDVLLRLLKAKREAVEFGTFRFMEKDIQCDAASRLRIVQTAAPASGATDEQWTATFPGWRCADDTMLALTRTQMLDLSVAAAQHTGTVFAVYSSKLAQIEAGEPCDINSGWPE